MPNDYFKSCSEAAVASEQQTPQLSVPLPGGSYRVNLSDQASWKIGRGKKNQIVLPSKCVSRLHAIIELVPMGDLYFVYLNDAGSLNGTFVNQRRAVDKVFLLDKDVITLGNMTLTFHYPSQRTQTDHGTLSHSDRSGTEWETEV
jgi:adenylate cyclase